MIEVQLGAQTIPVQIFNTTLGGVRALTDAATVVDIDSRTRKTANGSDFTDKVAVTENLQYQNSSSGAVARAVSAVLADRINAFDFIPVAEQAAILAGTSTYDASADIQDALQSGIDKGKRVRIPGKVRVDQTLSLRFSSYPAWQVAFTPGLVIEGDNQGRVVIDSRVANGYLFDIDSTNPHTSTFQAVLGGSIKGVTIRNGASVANSGGIKVRASFQFLIEDVHIFDMSGTGIKVECSTGDLDGSVHVIVNRCRIENCDVWCIDAAAINGNNEIGQLAIIDSFIQYGGLNEAKAITGITKANPAVVTSNAHGYVNGDLVYLCGMTGMTEVDSMIANQAFVVAGATTNTFQLTGINSTAYGTFSAGFILPRDPKSGGIKWKGQQLRIINGGAVLCNNASLYIPGGSGLAQDVTLQNFTVENPGGFGVLITGLRNLDATILHLYSNQSFTAPNYAGWLLDGQTSQVSNIILDRPCVRATAAETNYVYFKQFGANADLQTNRVRNIDYKQSGFAGQRWVEGFQFDPVEEQCALVLTATTNIRLAPTNKGNFSAGRRSAPVVGTVKSTTGEVIAVAIPSTGINQSNTLVGGGALANNTTYNVYKYDATDTLGRWALDINTTAPVYDNTVGKPVMTGDASRIWKGRVRTDGSGQFVITNTSWLNPEVIPAPVTGAESFRWLLTNGAIAVKTTAGLPSSEAAFTYSYDPSYETLVTYDPPSLAAGASTTTDVTVVCAAGDYCSGVRFATGFGGLTATGCVKAANTVTVTLTNNTAGTIDLASGLLGIKVEKR